MLISRSIENDFIGVIGPNGGGKTTLLKVILGLVKPVRGKLIFNHELMNGSKIGYLPQISTADNTLPGYSQGCYIVRINDTEEDYIQDVGYRIRKKPTLSLMNLGWPDLPTPP